jgi:peptide-methionine (S)-S-oxide reductase
VTKVSSAVVFYKAEEYHQDYYASNSEQGYCQMVIAPKLEKLRKYYKSKLK